jgi:DNA-directed RNA polymerase subunit M/transcription elongation factor TFIIS
MSHIDQNIRKENIKKMNKYIKFDFAEKIELGIYDFSVNSASEIGMNDVSDLIEGIYNTKLDEIINGLSNNKDLVKNIDDAYNLACAEPDKINPSKYQDMLKKKEIAEFKKNDLKTTNAFTCPKCKKKECTVTERQTRSGDEPATVFVTCQNCGYSFTFS